MSEPTKEELQAAADLLMAADKAMITRLDNAIKQFQQELDSIAESMPSTMSYACQALTRIKGSAANQFFYELQNVKSQYGMAEPLAPISTPA